MQPHIPIQAEAPAVYVDATPLADEHLTGIGRYTARIGMALAARGARVRFFSQDQELLPPPGLDWSADQDLNRWAAQVWRDRRLVPLGAVPDDAIGLWTATRPRERKFPVELSILHDLSPLIVPWSYDPQTRAEFQFFFASSLLSSDAALAVSHSTKADAGWLTDFAQDRIVVAHPGPSQCVLRHLHEGPVSRRQDVGLAVYSPEPRKNAGFVIDWFRSSKLLPADAELWWVGRVDEALSPRHVMDLERGRGGRRFRFLGAVSDQQLCELYQTVDWSIYPLLYEGFGFPVLDSLRHGVPVLASGNSSLREFNHPGVYFFDPRDPATLDLAWTECWAAGPRLVSKEQLDEQYNWDRVAGTILDLAHFTESVECPRRQTMHQARAEA